MDLLVWWTVRVDLLVVDCEGGRVCGGLCWWWTVRTDLLVVDCDHFFSLLVYCSFYVVSTPFLCSLSLSPM